jgi:hypothetical protein
VRRCVVRWGVVSWGVVRWRCTYPKDCARRDRHGVEIIQPQVWRVERMRLGEYPHDDTRNGEREVAQWRARMRSARILAVFIRMKNTDQHACPPLWLVVRGPSRGRSLPGVRRPRLDVDVDAGRLAESERPCHGADGVNDGSGGRCRRRCAIISLQIIIFTSSLHHLYIIIIIFTDLYRAIPRPV